MNSLATGVLEVLKLPFAPFVEFGKAMDGLLLEPASQGESREGYATSERALAVEQFVYEFNQEMERLFAERECLLDEIRAEALSRTGIRHLRELAAQFKALGDTCAPLVPDYKRISFEMASTAFGAANELSGFAERMEDELLSGGASPSATSTPDPKLLTALDRLGFSQEDLPKLEFKTLNERYKERAFQFHPDTKPEKERPFYGEQMKRLNEAKDLLTIYLEKRA